MKDNMNNLNNFENSELEDESDDMESLLVTALHQFLELFETMMENCEQFNKRVNIAQLMTITILGAIISKGQGV